MAPQQQENNNPLFDKLPINRFPIQVQTGLGDNIDQYIALSPTLTKQIQELKKRHWKFIWRTDPGSGALPNEDGSGQIMINKQYDPGNDTDLNALMKIKYVVSTLAHEVGHALSPTQYDRSSLKACVQSALYSPGSEADASYNNVIVRQEILMNTNQRVDFVNNGIDQKDLLNRFQKIVINNNKPDAIKQMGDIYKTVHPSVQNNQTYEEYYTDYCKKIVKKR